MPRRTYTKKEKLKAISFIVKKGMNYAEASRKTGVSKKSLFDWIAIYHPGFSMRNVKPGPKPKDALDLSPLDDPVISSQTKTDMAYILDKIDKEIERLEFAKKVILRIDNETDV